MTIDFAQYELPNYSEKNFATRETEIPEFDYDVIVTKNLSYLKHDSYF